MTTKEGLIDSLYKIMCSATTTAADRNVTDNAYFKRRVLGFRAEVAFEALAATEGNLKFLEGGQLISKKLFGAADQKNAFIYTTISSDNPADYKQVYATISAWDEVSELLYIKIEEEGWDNEDFNVKEVASGPKIQTTILKPAYRFFLYDKNTGTFIPHSIQTMETVLGHFNSSTRLPSIFPLRGRGQFDYFAEYDLSTLKKIYANRYFLDVILRKAQGRQIIDLDGFLQCGNKLVLVEIKEKTPITEDSEDKQNWKYGWDSRRILWYLYLRSKINLPILYNVRRINNREERAFVEWDSIYLDDFLKGVSWSNSRGGGGGEDTLLAPYLFFERAETIFSKLV